MDPTEHRAALLAEARRIAAVPPTALGAPVAACPGWDVQRLIGHLGRVHHWAAAHLASDPASDEEVSGGPRPPTGDAILPWYRESVDLLVAELDRHDPDAPARTFAGPADARFWFRRQAHEVAVHRWDLEDAVAPGEAAPIDPALAADGLDEWLGFFVPRFLARHDRIPPDLVGATVHVHCTDEGLVPGAGEWLLRLTEDGSELERAHAKGDAALRGPASDLLLVAWHRLPLDRVDGVGDLERAAAVLDLVHVG